MIRIKNILSVKPFSVICEWTNGEIREIDFTAKLQEWASEPNSVFKKLLDENIFLKVTLDTEMKTLVWENLLTMRDTLGNEISAPLDLCPDVLYEMSSPVETQFRKMA